MNKPALERREHMISEIAKAYVNHTPGHPKSPGYQYLAIRNNLQKVSYEALVDMYTAL